LTAPKENPRRDSKNPGWSVVPPKNAPEYYIHISIVLCEILDRVSQLFLIEEQELFTTAFLRGLTVFAYEH
jgi:hypothetical protein